MLSLKAPALDVNRPAPMWLIVLLAAVTAIGPFATQAFLPALPAVALTFEVAPGRSQLTLSLAFLSIAISTLAYGPLSDRYGRRPVMHVGIGLFILGSLGCVLAPTLETLVVARVLQAAGGAAGLVLARAIARDLYGPERSATVIAQLVMVMVLALMLAPGFGGIVNDLFHWRAIFVALSAGGVLVLLGSMRYLAESHTEAGVVVESPRDMLHGFGALLRSPMFCLLGAYPALSSAIFFAFIAGSPYVMVDLLGRPTTEYGLYFILIAAGFMLGNIISVRIGARVGMLPMMTIGMWIALLGVLLCGLFVYLDRLSPMTLFLPIVLAQVGQGMGMPNAQAASLNQIPHRAGTASALTGFAQMMSAAIVTQLVGSSMGGTAWPLVAFMAFGAVTGLLVSIAAQRLDRRRGAAKTSGA
jgi:MFS transporter, DHA1 family, multidrug resistance protein